jgi:hypothetical protein
MEEIKDILWGLGQLGAGIGFIGIAIALYTSSKNKTELKKQEEQRRIKELEIESQKNQLKVLEKENKKYDRLIRCDQDPRH